MASQFRTDFAGTPTEILKAQLGESVTYNVYGGSSAAKTALWQPDSQLSGYTLEDAEGIQSGVLRIASADLSAIPTGRDTVTISSVTWYVMEIGRTTPFYDLQLAKLEDTAEVQTVTETADNYGSFTETWAATISSMPCHFYTLSGREIERLDKLQIDASYGLICAPQSSAISEKQRVKFNSLYYDILFSETNVARAEYWKLFLRRRA